MFFRQLRFAVYENITYALLILIVLIIFSKLAGTYLSVSGRMTAPESQFSTDILGRDLSAYTVLPVYEIREQKTPFIFGYGSVFVATIVISTLELLGVCNPNDPTACSRIMYQLFLISSIGGLFLYVYLSTHPLHRTMAVLVYIAFILGVPMNKAIEAGNLDAIFAGIYGALLYFSIQFVQRTYVSQGHAALVGILMGLLLSSKAFFLPGILLTIWFTRKNFTVLLWFIASYIISSMWPWVYGVQAGIFDVFAFGMRGSDAFGSQLFTQVNYGNNAIISYVSNVLQTVDAGILTVPIHTALTYAISVCVFFLIYILPLIQERVDFRRAYVAVRGWNTVLRAQTLALLYTYATVLMLTMTAWSYDYRIVYLVPAVLLLLTFSENRKTKEMLYWAIIMLFLKCMWIPKDRIMNVFLYAHFYLLIRAAVSLYVDSSRLSLRQGRKTR